MKNVSFLLLATLLLAALPSCGAAKEERPTSQATEVLVVTQAPELAPTTAESTMDEMPPLGGSEYTVNGIGAGTTQKQLLEKLGKPLRVERVMEFTTYEYGNVAYSFTGDGSVDAIHIKGKAEQTPENIQVGDPFREVAAKFPDGYALSEGDAGNPTLVVASKALKVYFQDGAVASMQVFY